VGAGPAWSCAGAVAILRLLAEEKVAPLDNGRARHVRLGAMRSTNSQSEPRCGETEWEPCCEN
jgi:hypothetical protein